MENRLKNLLFFLIISIFLFSELQAQRFGGNAPTIKWKQIQSPAGKLIYGQAAEASAKRVTTIINNLAGIKQGALGNELKPIDIVLQTEPIITNGYVGLAPWRSEFYLTPMQNGLYFGSTKWIDNLAVHEYRHVHQYANFRKGLSKWAYFLAGEEGQSLANAAAVPDWFFEGDAVYSETKFLSQGRGRMPYFFDPYHALWLSNKNYSFQKLRNGSLRDFVPDHYALGYLLVQYGYKTYGDDFWGKVTDDAVRFKGIVYPFQQAIKKYAGIPFDVFVQNAIGSYRSAMKMNNEGDEKMISSKDENKVVDYQHPLWIGKDSILALRSAYDEIAKWVLLHKGNTTRLAVKDIGVDDYFTYRNGKIVYTAYHPDERWQWREYNDIMIYDMSTRTTNRITKDGRYFSPELSHDGKMLVAVHVDGDGRSTIKIIDVGTKMVTRSFENPSNYFYSYPVFSADDARVFVIGNDGKGSSCILALDLLSGKELCMTPLVQTPMAFLRLFNQKLIFTVPHEQRNELWSFDLSNKEFYILSSAATGSYAGGLDEEGNRVVYARPTAHGVQLYSRLLSGAVHIDSIVKSSLIYPTTFSSEDHSKLIDKSVETMAPTPYRKSNDIINIHSWRPYYEQPEWSFTIYGQNVLNTLQTNLKYTFNENERSQKVGMNSTFGAFFPWISGGVDYTFSRSFADAFRSLKWNELKGNIGLRLPLNYSSGKFFRNLDLSAALYGVSLDYDRKSKPSTPNKSVAYIQEQLTWSMQMQKSVQQIFPHFAFNFKMQNRHAIASVSANQFYASTQFYLPGIKRTHSFVVGYAYQSRDTLRQYIFENGFGMPRGYSGLNFPRMQKLVWNYHMPLLYPDRGYANLVYVRRVRTNIFYDMGWFKSLRTGRTNLLRSAGIEMYFDTRWWNQHPVTVGFRYSRLIDANQILPRSNSNRWEFILPLNLIPG